MQGDALLDTLLAGPEPRPFVGRLLLGRQPDDVLVEACRYRNVFDDQDDLGQAEAAQTCWASYMPNSSRSVFEISPIVARTRNASRIGTSRLPSPCAVSRTASRARFASSPFLSARTRAVRSSCRFSAAGSRRCSSIGSSSPSVKLLTPTITRSPDSTSCCQRNAACSISPCTKPCSTAVTAPPSSSMCWINPQAFASSSPERPEKERK